MIHNFDFNVVYSRIQGYDFIYMNRNIFFLGMVVMASVCVMRVCAAEPDKAMLLQDENFFLQDEIKKLQAELIDKDNALKKVLLDRETSRYDLDQMTREKETLEDKIRSLRKTIAARDEQMPRDAELAALPYRSQMEDAVKQLKVMTMALEEKNAHVAGLIKETEGLQGKIDILTAEKMSLLQSVKKIAAEHDALKAQVDGQIADVKADAEKKVKDFQVRLTAEQTLVQEKIVQAKKPLEDRIAGMETSCQTREKHVADQGHLAEALLQDKIRKLEQQIVLLRENAGLEVKKVQDASLMEIKNLKDQLEACRQGPQAVKK